MRDVFISYSHKDRGIGERITKDLTGSGLNVVCYGESLLGEAGSVPSVQEFRRANYVLVLLSPAYVESHWGRVELQELAFSESEGGPRVLPILVQNTDFPLFLRNRHFADFREDYDAGFALVEKTLATRPKVSKEVRARRLKQLSGLLSVLISLIASAAGAFSFFYTTRTKGTAYTFLLGLGVTIGMTGFVALISMYQRYRLSRRNRRSAIHESVARSVAGTYMDTLDESSFNPAHIRE